MFSTVVLAAVVLSLTLVSFVLWALCLRFGLRWAKVPDVTTWRIVAATTAVIILQVAFYLLFLFVSPSTDTQSILLSLVELVTAVMVPCVVISTVFHARFLRALQAWLPTLVVSVTTSAFAILGVRPFLYESFVASANSMAPTLLGHHWQGTCPECRSPSYCSPSDERYGDPAPFVMICDHFHVTEAVDVDKAVHSGDRFIVAKFLSPQRWDLMVFQYPEDPALLYVKRLVGLPGETVQIQDGSVWVDGERQIPPDSLQGIQYLSEMPEWFGPRLWGSEDQPVWLGDDEYFVLGDFSAQSADSRLWRLGAPGHNPFAVPESYIKGVVTHTFWPLNRLRIH